MKTPSELVLPRLFCTKKWLLNNAVENSPLGGISQTISSATDVGKRWTTRWTGGDKIRKTPNQSMTWGLNMAERAGFEPAVGY